MLVDLKERLEKLAPPTVREPNVDRAWRKGRRMRNSRLAVRSAGVVGIVVLGALVWPTSGGSNRTLQPAEEETSVAYEEALIVGASYEAQPQMGLEGWYSQHTDLRLKGEEDGPVAWISNAPFRGANINDSSYPMDSLARLPEDGALLIVSLHTRADFENGKDWLDVPERTLPLSLDEARGPDHSYEGQPASRPDVVAYGLDARVGNYYLRTEAFFAGVPTEEELRDANAALASLEILPEQSELTYSGAPLPDATTTHLFNGNPTTREDADFIELPSDWQFHEITGFPSTFAFSSYPTKIDTGSCDSNGPLETLPSDGTFVWAYEISRGDEIPRPEHFTLDPQTFAPFEGSGCRPTYLLSFEESERSMAVWVALGDNASARTKALVLRALDSLELQP